VPYDSPWISVIAPARNEGQRIREMVSSVVAGRSCLFPLQIVVVDDNSSDDCSAGLAQLYSWPRDHVRIDVIRLPRWSGIPYARNVGAAAARAGILFITDANVRFPPYWDVPIREQIAPGRVLCATIASISSPFRGYGGTLHIASMGFSWLTSPTACSGFVPLSPCAGTVISNELFRRIGGYDTAMPIYGAAEPEFSVRLWLSGAEVVSVPDLIVQHRFRPPCERRPFLQAIALMQVRNYLRFGLLYLDEAGVKRMLHYYATTAPELFERALRQAWAGDVWYRRDLLQRRLPGRFDSFVRRFGLLGARGQFAGG
jgi:glycosyltransferase involved in cell wall biosynthesis